MFQFLDPVKHQINTLRGLFTVHIIANEICYGSVKFAVAVNFFLPRTHARADVVCAYPNGRKKKESTMIARATIVNCSRELLTSIDLTWVPISRDIETVKTKIYEQSSSMNTLVIYKLHHWSAGTHLAFLPSPLPRPLVARIELKVYRGRGRAAKTWSRG